MTAATDTLRRGPAVGADRRGIEALHRTCRTCTTATVPVRAPAVTAVGRATLPVAGCQQW